MNIYIYIIPLYMIWMLRHANVAHMFFLQKWFRQRQWQIWIKLHKGSHVFFAPTISTWATPKWNIHSSNSGLPSCSPLGVVNMVAHHLTVTKRALTSNVKRQWLVRNEVLPFPKIEQAAPTLGDLRADWWMDGWMDGETDKQTDRQTNKNKDLYCRLVYICVRYTPYIWWLSCYGKVIL
jgi:hypothetical protein